MSLLRFYFIVAFLFFNVYSIHAEPYCQFQSITSRNGIANNTIQTLFIDSKGFLWIGTSRGLSRYDGINSKNYFTDATSLMLTDNRINAISEDINHNIWVGNNEGLFIIERKSNRIRSLFEKDKFKNILKEVGKLYTDKNGIIWIGTYKGLFYYNPVENKLTYLKHSPDLKNNIPPNGIMFINSLDDDNIIVGHYPNMVSTVNIHSKKVTRIIDKIHMPLGMEYEMITSATIDKRGTIWLGFLAGHHGALFTKDSIDEKIKVYPNWSHNGYCLVYDEEEDIVWAGTDYGAYRIEAKAKKHTIHIHKSNDASTISDNFVQSIVKDNKNNLWFGTLNKGVSKLKYYPSNVQNIEKISFKYGEVNTNFILVTPDSSIWLCTEIGLMVKRKKSHEIIKIELPKVNNNSVPTATYKDGHVIFYWNGCNRKININTLKISKLDIPDLNNYIINGYHRDTNENEYWVSNKVLFVKKNGMSKFFQIDTKEFDNILDNDDNPTFYENKDYVFVSVDKRIYRINKFNPIQENYPIFPSKNWGYIESNREISNFIVQNDTLIYANHQEIVYLNLNNNQVKKIPISLIKESTIVPELIHVDKGKIIFSSYDQTILYDGYANKYYDLDFIDNNFLNPNLLVRYNLSKVILVVVNGFILMDCYKYIEKIKNNSKPIITNLYLDDDGYTSLKSKNILIGKASELEKVTFTKQQSSFSLEMNLMNFANKEYNEYAYFLEGYDKDYNYIGDRNIATYTKVSAGDYIFKFKAKNRSGEWSEIQSLIVIIEPAYYETWWFRMVIIAVSIAMIFLIFMARIKYLEKQREKLKKLIDIRTKELQEKNNEVMQQNAEIISQSEEISANMDQIAAQNELISELYKDQTDSIQVSQKIQASILPSEYLLRELFQNIYVFYQPKDIVSGDFYWCYATDEYKYLALADCTGHGVSGAFMSLMGYNFLNTTMQQNKNLSPANILKNLAYLIIKEFNQQSEDAVTKDGMDVSIIRYNMLTKELLFAGGGTKAYLVKSNESFIQIEGDKNSVGILPYGKIPTFNDHIIEIGANDTLYMFSDGYPGQFGGDFGDEKLKYGRFKSIVEEISKMPFGSQKQLFETKFLSWKKNTPQTDDIMVAAVKF
ncbi:MAG: two-component regulator propeller domain-containing protein [Bacteroidota bacterium]|nr:two-component regulator propeller domain-containing protein [Bacteroidota bacterium]